LSKLDLYGDRVDDAIMHYATGQFYESIEKVRGRVGTDNLRWALVPACGYVEPFTWNGETTTPKLHMTDRTELLKHLLAKVSSLCD
jgi:hypothetical protein